VNVTLLFSLAQYEAIHTAYIKGLERRVAANQPISDIHSVASFFVSRVDTAVDAELPEGSPLRGKAAVANAKLAYRRFSEIVASDRWQRLAAEGATVQRTLWASTGTKNPEYSDILYVDELIGPDCVNTMPEGTIAAFQDHGTVARTVDADVDEARASIAALAEAGVSLDAVTKKLEIDGVKAFSDSFDSLIETIRQSLDAQRAA
jgi:transaldolase